jgi:hypothetical protein
VSYRGIVELDGEHGPVNIWLPGGDFVVKEQPFVDEVDVSLAAVPPTQQVSDIISKSLLGWVMIQQESLLRPRASDVTESIEARLYVDGDPVPRWIFDTMQEGGVLCFPILGQHVNQDQTITLRLWLGSGPAKTSAYAEAARELDFSAEQVSDGLDLTVGNQARRVTNRPEHQAVTLDQIANRIEMGEFEEQTKSEHSSDKFRVKSYDPLRIVPSEMLLLHFTDK